MASCLEKVKPDAVPPAGAGSRCRLSLSAAGGEVEAVQLVLCASGGPVDIEEVEVEPLTLGSVAVRPQVRTVGFVRVVTPSHGDGEPGLQPDPLLPFRPFRLEGCCALWIDIRVPREAPAGTQSCAVRVRSAGGETVEARLELRVYGFALPFPQRLVTAFGLYEKPLRQRYGSRYEQMLALYRENLWAHRVTHLSFPATDIPTPQAELAADGSLRVDYAEFDRAVETNLRRGMNRLDVPLPARYLGKEKRLDSPFDRPTLERIVGDVERHLAERGWLEMAYFFLVDEPGRDAFDVFRDIEEMLKRAAPRIKRRLDMGYGAYGGKPGTVKEAAYRKLRGLVEIWVPHIDCVDQEFLAEEQRRGNEAWWYICCSAKHPYPNCLIDYPLLDSRVPFWMMFDAGVTGYAYWTVNWWGKDPFVDPLSFANTNGDGVLLYPGEDGPLDSLRWEATRDGFEDYEYLKLLDDRVRAAGSGPAADAGRQALAEVRRVAASPTQYAADPAALLGARDKVGRAIEELAG
jgi:hypothetical protein